VHSPLNLFVIFNLVVASVGGLPHTLAAKLKFSEIRQKHIAFVCEGCESAVVGTFQLRKLSSFDAGRDCCNDLGLFAS